jgi:protein farnesyltransferase subunit beta
MLLDRRRLQTYVLACCQSPDGGMRDKPGKARDLYHTCYCLSGLSSAQHYGGGGVLGPPHNLLARVDAALNVTSDRLAKWLLLLDDAV